MQPFFWMRMLGTLPKRKKFQRFRVKRQAFVRARARATSHNNNNARALQQHKRVRVARKSFTCRRSMMVITTALSST